MRTTLGIVAGVLLGLAIFSALLGMGGVAGAATGGGGASDMVDIAFMMAKALFALSLIFGLLAIAWPTSGRK